MVNTSFRLAPWADVLYAMDRAWWNAYLEEVQAVFQGERISPLENVPGTVRVEFTHLRNSGAGAIALAVYFGATRIILLGYDCQRTGGRAHWHDDHPDGLGNARTLEKWPAQFDVLRSDTVGLEVINASQETALQQFARMPLAQALGDKPALVIEGMHGLGDNLHQRGVIRAILQTHDVWLETPWPCLYHDLNVKLVSKGSKLRTQAKNARREAARFEAGEPPADAERLRVTYPPAMVRQHGSVYAAMSAQCGVPMGDFSLPVRQEWFARADNLIASWSTDKPILIYRPLVERKEWGGCHTRNPDIAAYCRLIESIRERFFVVSVADLVPDAEWMVSRPIPADATYHAGELDIEVLAGLFKRAALVFTSPGFAVILAQSVGTAVVGVFGGYENSKSFTAGEKYAPCLWIDPIEPCQCFSHKHNCKKAIDVDKWLPVLNEFAKRQYENVDRRLQA